MQRAIGGFRSDADRKLELALAFIGCFDNPNYAINAKDLPKLIQAAMTIRDSLAEANNKLERAQSLQARTAKEVQQVSNTARRLDNAVRALHRIAIITGCGDAAELDEWQSLVEHVELEFEDCDDEEESDDWG